MGVRTLSCCRCASLQARRGASRGPGRSTSSCRSPAAARFSARPSSRRFSNSRRRPMRRRHPRPAVEIRFPRRPEQSAGRGATRQSGQGLQSAGHSRLGAGRALQCDGAADEGRPAALLLLARRPSGAMAASSTVRAFRPRNSPRALLRYFGRKGWKKVALITSTDASGQDAYKNFKSLFAADDHKDVELVAEAQLNPTDVSAAAQIQRLKGANPDVLVAWSTGGPIGTVFKAIHDAGIELPVATTNGNQTYAQMAQYAAFLPKELYIPAADFLKSTRPAKPDDAAAAKDGVLQGVRRHRHQAGRSVDLCLGSGAARGRRACAS